MVPGQKNDLVIQFLRAHIDKALFCLKTCDKKPLGCARKTLIICRVFYQFQRIHTRQPLHQRPIEPALADSRQQTLTRFDMGGVDRLRRPRGIEVNPLAHIYLGPDMQNQFTRMRG